MRELLETHRLEGFRIEGHPRRRYVAASFEGEVAEQDRALVGIRDAAERLGVKPSTIRWWIRKGRLQSFRVEGDRRLYVEA